MRENTDKTVIPVTAEVMVREATIKDAEAIFQLIDTDRGYLREWLPFVDFTHSARDTAQFLKSVTAKDNHSDLIFAILVSDAVAGIIGFKTMDFLNRKLEIGYWLAETQQGKGIVCRSCAALIRYAFTAMGMNRIQIKVAVGNSKSSRIPERLGFKLEGIERAGELIRHKYVDLQVYSLLKQEWQQKLGHPL